MSETDEYAAALESGMNQAYRRLLELEVQSAGVPWGDNPRVSAAALAQLEKEGATATLDATERLRGDRVELGTVLEVTRSLAASPWDRGATRDAAQQDLVYHAARFEISLTEVEEAVYRAHEGDPIWREVDGTARWVNRESDRARIEAVARRDVASENVVRSAPELAPGLQRIADLHRLDYPTRISATQVAARGNTPSYSARSFDQNLSDDRGYGR